MFRQSTWNTNGNYIVESLINNEKGLMIGISNGKITKTDLSKAIKGKTKINKELLRMSRIMNT